VGACGLPDSARAITQRTDPKQASKHIMKEDGSIKRLFQNFRRLSRSVLISPARQIHRRAFCAHRHARGWLRSRFSRTPVIGEKLWSLTISVKPVPQVAASAIPGHKLRADMLAVRQPVSHNRGQPREIRNKARSNWNLCACCRLADVDIFREHGRKVQPQIVEC